MFSKKFAGVAVALIFLMLLALALLVHRRTPSLIARRIAIEFAPFPRTLAPRVPDRVPGRVPGRLPDRVPGRVPAARRPAVPATPYPVPVTEFTAIPGAGRIDARLDDSVVPLAALVVTPESSWHGYSLVVGGAPTAFAPPRPEALPALYVSFATLQALDAYSTWKAVNGRRAREANPVLTGISGSLPKLLIAKGASTAASVYVVERLWKRNRKAAVLTMVGINAAYAAVVTHNYRTNMALSRSADATRPPR